jgi:molybdopterin converting factor small subunit
MMTVSVLYFAQARELAGQSREVLELAEGAPVSDAIAALKALHPALESLWPHVAVAVDGVLARSEMKLHADAELALLPPVSGG